MNCVVQVIVLYRILFVLWVTTIVLTFLLNTWLQNIPKDFAPNQCKPLFQITSKKTNFYNLTQALTDAEHHRIDPVFDPTTEPYITLSKFVPQTLHWKLVPNGTEGATSHEIPSISCGKLRDYAADDISKCLKEIVTKKSKFQIVFFGDSKVRGLYSEFLFVTRGLNYTIRETNRDKREMNLEQFYIYLLDDDGLWTSKTARSNRVPGFSADLIFASMGFRVPSFMDNDKPTLQLQKWALGEEPSPDILVIGYTHWTFLLPVGERGVPYTNIMLIDTLFNTHSVVISYLKRIAKHTKIFILAETRHKPHAVTFENIRVTANKPVYSEYSEEIMFTLLRKPKPKTNKWWQWVKDYFYSALMTKRQTKYASLAKKYFDMSMKSKQCHQSFLADCSRITLLEYFRINNLSNATKPIVPTPHLRPCYDMKHEENSWHENIIWWDTHLPLHMSTVHECHQLFMKDRKLILKITDKLVRNVRTIYLADTIRKINPNYIFNPFVMKNISSNHHSYEALLNNSVVAKYMDSRLNCVDDIHASASTIRAEVLTMLNYVCNSFIVPNSDQFCCTSESL